MNVGYRNVATIGCGNAWDTRGDRGWYSRTNVDRFQHNNIALSHFNGAGDKKLVVNAPALAARAAADPGFVDFDMVAF